MSSCHFPHRFAWLVPLVFVAGCSISPLAKRATAFSGAAASTTKATANAYQIVEQVHYDSEIATLVSNYDGHFPMEKVQPFLSDKDVETRTQILNGLTQYAETLAYVSGDQPLADVDTQAQAVGKSLQSLSQNDTIAPLAKSAHVSGMELNAFTTALDALGRTLVEQKRRKELPSILKQMKEPIDRICKLLQDDIGDPQHSGLRNELSNNYKTLIHKQEAFIKDNPNLSPTERRAAIEELPKLAKAMNAADGTLAATQDALGQLAKTHDVLVDTASAKDAPLFKTRLAELVQTAQQLDNFYGKLPQ